MSTPNQPTDQPTPARLSRRTLLKQAALLSVSLPLALQAAACAPVPVNQAAAGGQAAPAAAKPASGDAKTVRLTWGKGGLTLYAKTRGVFEKTLKDKGLSTEWIGPFPNHAPTLQAVTGGSADFSFGGSSTPALAAIIAGSPLVFTTLILSDPRTTAILVKPDSGIKSVKDLVGKKVAANRSGLGEFLLIAALEKNNVQRDQVEIAYLNPPDAAPAFSAGKVDAWVIWSGPREIAEVNDKAVAIFTENNDLTQAERIDVGSFLVRDDYARDHADIVRTVVDAYKVEAEWASKNPKEVGALLAKESGWSQPVVDKIVAYNTQTRLIAPDDTKDFDLQKAADWLTAHKVLTSKIAVAEHFAKI